MAIALIASLLAFALAHAVADLVRLRDWSWFRGFVVATVTRLPAGSLGTVVALLLWLMLPVCALALLCAFVGDALYGALALLIGLATLFYCLGPRDLDQDIRDWLRAEDPEERKALSAVLNAPGATKAIALVQPVFGEGLRRWFGPLFWFLAFGPAGALCYRLAVLLADEEQLDRLLDERQRADFRVLALALSFLPAHLMALALALASDFDAVATAWKSHHREREEGFLSLDLGFLAATARACIDADDVEESFDADVSQRAADEPLKQAHMLLNRILVVWFAAVALVVLAAVR